MKNKLAAVTLLTPISTFAHDSHGLDGPAHWHATDVLGFVVIAVLFAAAVWWSGRK